MCDVFGAQLSRGEGKTDRPPKGITGGTEEALDYENYSRLGVSQRKREEINNRKGKRA